MSKPVGMVVDEVIAAMITRPGTFRIGEHTLEDTKTGIEYWIANTWLAAGIHRPFKLRFGVWNGIRFHRAVRALKAYQAVALTRIAC